MKKMFLSILALVGLASFASAATPTVTPNATLTAAQTQIEQTQTAVAVTATYVKTAFPTLTPTLTPTGTLTPSPTFTPAPKQLKSDYRRRIYFQPQQMTQADGMTALGTTALPGATSAWLTITAQNQTAAVLSTGAAEVRLGFTVPWDFKGNARLYFYMNAQSIGDSVTITANLNGQSFNCTTQTTGTFSYFPPRAGAYVMTGSATQIVAGYGGQQVEPLWDTPVQVVSRVMMPLNAGAARYSTSNPSLGPSIQPGDILNFDIVRTSGGSGNVNVLGEEFQYDYNQDMQP